MHKWRKDRLNALYIYDDSVFLLKKIGTAGYSKTAWSIGNSYADDPVLTPAIYDPDAPAGSRWSSTGFSASTVPRMYHSTATLLPDGTFVLPSSFSIFMTRGRVCLCLWIESQP